MGTVKMVTKAQLVDGTEVDIAAAITMRDNEVDKGNPPTRFYCPQCEERVRPHRVSATGTQAHFEHIRKPNH